MVMIKTLSPIKEAACQHTPNATKAVNWCGVHWIINLQLLNEHGRTLVEKCSNQSSSKSTAAFHVAAACRDGDQACKNAIAQATNVILLCDGVAKDEDSDSTSSRRQCCVHRNLGIACTKDSGQHCKH